MKSFSHQHFLFRPEFMNFNQMNAGRSALIYIRLCEATSMAAMKMRL